MAIIPLRSLKLHGLNNTYIINTPPEIREITLLAENWMGGEPPYIYRLDLPWASGKTVEVVEDVRVTMEQMDAIENARIKSNPLSDENILYAFGDKPTVNVPVLLVVR